MAEPLTGSAAVVGAVAKLVAELAQLGYSAWRNNQKAREKLIGILMHVQDELNRNYKALQDTYNGSQDEWLETGAYATAIEAISHALQDSPSVLDPLRRAYQLITSGVQARLRQTVRDDGSDEVVQLWALVGQASYEIDRWFRQEGVVPTKFSKEECADRRPDELVGGWPPAERLRVLKVWRQFIDACRTHQAHEYTFNELGLSSMYAEPGRELEYREYAESSTDPFTVSSLLTVSTSSGSNHQFGCSTCGPNGTQCYWTPSDYRGETRMAGHQSGTSNGRAAGRRVGDPRPLDSISQAIYTADGIVMGTWAPVGQPRIPAQIQRDHVGHF